MTLPLAFGGPCPDCGAMADGLVLEDPETGDRVAYLDCPICNRWHPLPPGVIVPER